MCGLRGGKSIDVDSLNAKPVEAQRLLNKPKTQTAPKLDAGIPKGWGYNPYSVPIPPNDGRKLEGEVEGPVKDKYGNAPFSVPSLEEVMHDQITTRSNLRYKGPKGTNSLFWGDFGSAGGRH